MKRIFFASAFLLLFSGQLKAQLITPVITSMPCICPTGGGGIISVSPVPGATYYQWESLSCINDLLFNGTISPYQSIVPTVNITCVMTGQYCVFCVTAYNATDSSNAACDTIWGSIDVPVLAATNSPTGIPGTSGVYAVESPTAGCPSYIWYLTGDITFSNGSQTYSGGGIVNLNFGPSFTSGVLCVQAVTSFGLQTDTVCMTIIAPVGINENNDPLISFYYQSSLNLVTLEFADVQRSNVAIKIYDITGRLIHFQETIPTLGKAHLVIATPGLKKGVYFVEVTGNDFRKTFKFGKTD